MPTYQGKSSGLRVARVLINGMEVSISDYQANRGARQGGIVGKPKPEPWVSQRRNQELAQRRNRGIARAMQSHDFARRGAAA